MIVLGIETSCDETAVSIVDDQKNVLSNLVLSQIELHRLYGGVVPEVAARAHAEHLDDLVRQALQETELSLSDLDGIAATCGPGLIGGVMIGMVTAKALAYAADKPFLAVNHLEGHALTPRLTNNVPFPYLLLLVSGGHSQLLIVHDVGHYTELGSTQDDAAGECFDKSAKVMGLPYPGGPALEKLALQCKDPEQAVQKYNLPVPFYGQDHCDFSFSGLKSAVIRHVDATEDQDFTSENLSGLAYAVQDAICRSLTDRSAKAMARFVQSYSNSHPYFVVSGGVAANQAIRSALEHLAQEKGFQFAAPPLALCTDNAAMIAWAGLERLRQNMVDDLDFKARPRWPLKTLQEAGT